MTGLLQFYGRFITAQPNQAGGFGRCICGVCLLKSMDEMSWYSARYDRHNVEPHGQMSGITSA
jgi:hypothetical protein